MAIPVAVTLDRGDLTPIDVTPMIEEGSLAWSSVVPGGFGSCSFQVNGDFRQLMKLFPYLTIVRVVGDSGKVLFEGQIEDLSPTLSDNGVGMKVGAFGLQNVLKEVSCRAIWSKRDMDWQTPLDPPGVAWPPGYTVNENVGVTIGPFTTDLSRSGVQITGAGATMAVGDGGFAEWRAPRGTNLVEWIGTVSTNTPGFTQWEQVWFAAPYGGNFVLLGSANVGGPYTFNLGVSGYNILRLGTANTSAAPNTPSATANALFYDIRVLGVLSSEDGGAAGLEGFYGGTLINSLIQQMNADSGGNPVQPGTIEAGTDFIIDHLDAGERRTAYDILTEIASYYSREWAVWENGFLNWVTPQLSQPQWITPIASLETLDLDASVVNSQFFAIVLYTDAVSGLASEALAYSNDRRNPYVVRNRLKGNLVDAGTMTGNTAQQFANALLSDLGFGPVPAAGTISLAGETIVQHASAASRKAWEIRAGENVTIPELPMADVFTQDGRGECLFHVVSAEADTSSGMVTLTLDSYGSKRSDVLMARLAAVTQALGG